jgi:hypothetical protein
VTNYSVEAFVIFANHISVVAVPVPLSGGFCPCRIDSGFNQQSI